MSRLRLDAVRFSPRFRRHPNLVKEGPEQIKVTRSEQLWVADITYLPTADKFVYLSLVTDAHSRKIVGWHVHPSLQTEEVAQAMKMADFFGRDVVRVAEIWLEVERASTLPDGSRCPRRD